MLSQESRDRLLEFYNECEEERIQEMANALLQLLTINDVAEDDAELSISLLELSYFNRETNKLASDLLALVSFYIVTAPARIGLLNMLAVHINMACNESIEAVLEGKMKIGLDVIPKQEPPKQE